jgi:hypothetical protein
MHSKLLNQGQNKNIGGGKGGKSHAGKENFPSSSGYKFGSKGTNPKSCLAYFGFKSNKFFHAWILFFYMGTFFW